MDVAALTRRLVDAHNTGDDTGLLAGHAPGATVRFSGWPEPVSAEAWVAAQAGIRESFPDVRFEIRSLGTGPRHAVVELTMAGTNDGPLHLGTPTGWCSAPRPTHCLPRVGRSASTVSSSWRSTTVS